MTTGAAPGPGAAGELTPRAEAPEGVVVYIAVDDIDSALRGDEDAGGTVVTGGLPIPTMGWSAPFRDTEGNLIGLFQLDPTVQITGTAVPT